MAVFEPPARPSAVRLLLVEDHTPVRDILRELLAGWGYAVTIGVEAGQVLADLDAGGALPDVIVSDLRLPGEMDGLDLIRAIRTRAGSSIPALLVTADPAAPQREENILVLQKPVGAHALREKLDNVLLLSRSVPDPERS